MKILYDAILLVLVVMIVGLSFMAMFVADVKVLKKTSPIENHDWVQVVGAVFVVLILIAATLSAFV